MDLDFVAKVIKVQNNDMEVVINKGSLDGIHYGHRFLVYKYGEELFDPDTKDTLGFLEIRCGKAKVKHVQEKITTLISDEIIRKTTTKIVKRSTNPLIRSFYGDSQEEISQPEEDYLPFDAIDNTCLAKIINER